MQICDATFVASLKEAVLRKVQMGFRIFIWVALPHTPWCSWQRMNEANMNTEQKKALQAERDYSVSMVELLLMFLQEMCLDKVICCF